MHTLLNQKKRRYIASVRKLFQEIYGISDAGMTDQNRIWSEWAKLTGANGEKRLAEFWKDSKNSEYFRVRALAILLVHNLRWAPFPWKDEYEGDDDYIWHFTRHYHFNLKELRGKEREFTLKLLLLNLEHANRTARGHYNDLIRQALMFVDTEMGEQLNRYHLLNDPLPFYGLDMSSGFNPFLHLLESDVPQRYKEEADIRMRDIILAELRKERRPRESWEDAYLCYGRIVCRAGRNESYPLDFLASQVKFMLDLAIMRKPPISDEGYVTLIHRFQDPKYPEVRRSLAFGLTKSFPDGIPALLRSQAEDLFAEFGSEMGIGLLLRSALSKKPPPAKPQPPKADREAELLALMRK